MTASEAAPAAPEHAATWKFDYSIFHAGTRTFTGARTTFTIARPGVLAKSE